MFEKSKTMLFVCNVTNGYNDGGTCNPSTLPAGSGAFVKVPSLEVEEGALVSGLKYRFIHKDSNGIIRYSPIFTSANVKNATLASYAARTEQVTYVGYNGSSGSFDSANSTYYGMHIVLDHTFGLGNNSPLILTIPYKSTASATQYEVCNGLHGAALGVLARQAYKPFIVEKVNSGTGLATSGGACTVVNGSKYVTIVESASSANDAGKYNSDLATIAAGDLIRFGAANTKTYPVYKVVSVTGGGSASCTIELDQPYQGASGSVAAADMGVVAAASIGNFGLKFTGVSPTDAEFNRATDDAFVSSFKIQLGENFTTATVTYSTTPSIGVGTYQVVAALEAYCQFNEKDRTISAYPPTVRRADATSGYTYNMYSFDIEDTPYVDDATGQKPVAVTKVIIALKSNLSGEGFSTVLGIS